MLKMTSSLSQRVNRSWDYESIFNSLAEWEKVMLSQIKSESGIKCVLRNWYHNKHKESSQDLFCDGIWDNVQCWPRTPPGAVVTKLCSEIHPQYSMKEEGKVQRVCLMNGSWAQDNENIYAECIQILESYLEEINEHIILAPVINYILFLGSLLSLVCLSVSLAIFLHYRCLHCDRVTIQTHLILSLVLRFILMFIIAEPLVFGHAQSYRDVDILCEAVLVLFLYATFASVAWMFIQGLYLNIVLITPVHGVNTRQYLKLYYVIGWGIPASFVLVYVIVMLLREQERCWEGYSEMIEMWILLGPILFGVVMNGVFLCNILRIVLRKVRNSNSRPDSSQIKAAAKATAILFPVLGINNLVLLHNPGGEYNKYFVTLNTFFGSTQGIFVAIVYCFTNKEVLAAIRRSVQRANARRLENLNRTQNNNGQEAINMRELHVAP